ncbi:ATP-dependent RNA helicase HelY [Paraoerskovia marina]|uniref:ATP-dependent RNA helicase HelY n=1 Tax=Paraoerskovia marina TaxID=545619 RepID=A0A1H1SVX2_9CELL|nr:DEAD/DEAH box helicase [Paraoerskovia marina]SDS52132.1 ATP-dependent RNA helicase HelY [Paraoerskovia marina]
MAKRSSTSGTTSPEETGTSPAERYAAAQERAAAERGELGRFRAPLDFDLDPFQVQACQALEAGSGVLVAAPTGAGKTVVGEFAVHLALAAGRKAFYTTPIKALSNQKYADLVRRYGPDDVGLLTGDTSVNADAPVVVMTTEVLRNMLYAGSGALDGLAYVVMDEVHYLADRFRGPVWEEVIIHLPDDVQLVSLSATVSNAEEFGDWLAMVRGDTAVIVSERRPVPLWQHVVVSSRSQHHGPPELLDLYAHDVDPTDPGTNPPISPELVTAMRAGRDDGGPRGGDRGYRGRGGRRNAGRRGPAGGGRPVGRRGPARFAVVDTLAEANLLPAIYFIFSRAGCEGAVAQCLGAGLRLTTPAEESQIREIVETRAATLPPEDLDVLGYRTWSESLARGVAAHHAGMLPIFKETVEELFAAGLVKVVFATETLALGINMPARSVVLEKLVKFDGTGHVDLTPGAYTQLTGRAGRRGIDVEGHAIVVEHQGLDPVALAGLASRRLYPLTSSFRPTYNMAVNLVEQVGRARARDVLETSFAQFQADRGVVGLAKQAQAHAEALDGYAQAMRCDRGDFREYQSLRRRIGDREKELSRRDRTAARAQTADALDALRPGDVVQILGGRRAGYVTVVATGERNFDGPRPLVLDADRRTTHLTADDAPGGVRVVTRVRVPRGFNARVSAHRRDLAQTVRHALTQHDGPRTAHRTKAPASAPEDTELARLRRQLRSHPCHDCPEREDHARWGERWARLRTEHAALVRRVEGRTGTIARTFDHICDVLTELDYLDVTDGNVTVTDAGRWLRRLYAENDLVLAECLRRGTWDDLDAPALAAAVSTLVYQARRDDASDPPVPGGPDGRLAHALHETVRVWSSVDDLEAAHKVATTNQPDFGIVRPVHRWATGRSLEFVLRDTDLTAGDFVRQCKQVIDVLDQLAQAAPTTGTRSTARTALKSLHRGVVAYSSL